ncbi:MAG: glutathione S-transferase N-terminal domain-containing protein [Hyphomicrobiaceae bacterium]|nr:glutathione S-transferase N-terminal domain-containing protein [Hyphomicrobiaceae bacterium]
MRLYWSSRSPFVRKVMVVAHETGLVSRIETIRTVVAPTKPNAEVMALNPLNKLPTLVLDDGSALYDSRVIAEYLDSLHDGPRLFPPAGRPRFEALRLQALGDGALDFLLVGLSERARPEAQQSPELKAALATKFRAAFDRLEAEAGAGALAGSFGIGQIAVACVLGYADFRYAAEGWRNGRPKLAAFAQSIANRPSLVATTHMDAY